MTDEKLLQHLVVCRAKVFLPSRAIFDHNFIPFNAHDLSIVIPAVVSLTWLSTSTAAMASSSSNVVGVHYRVGKKIGEGSFGVIFEGTNLLNNQQVAIKFVWPSEVFCSGWYLIIRRNQERAMPPNYETNTEHTRYSWDAVSLLVRPSMVSHSLKCTLSWHTQCVLFRARRPSQHPRHRFTRPLPWRLIRSLQQEVFSEDSGNGRETNGMTWKKPRS